MMLSKLKWIGNPAAVLWLGLLCLCPAQAEEVGCVAEWEPVQTVLMHTPDLEVFPGILHPQAALFERVFSPKAAAEEAMAYVRLLEACGAQVHQVADVLMRGTLDEHGRIVEGPALAELRELAQRALTYETSRLPPEMAEAQPLYRQKVIAAMHPRDLVATILMRPTLTLEPTPLNTGMSSRYAFEPLMNLYFTRDQMITTRRGVVVGRMNSVQRAFEVDVMQLVLKRLNITPLHIVQDPGRLEGGDFMPAGDIAFLGCGLRTNAQAVDQLLQQRVFGCDQVVIVKDPWQNQAQMHLDTYFNLLGPQLALLAADRMPGHPEFAEEKRLRADVYLLTEGTYRLHQQVDFVEYLQQVLGYRMLPVAETDQLAYGVNVLTLSRGKVACVSEVSLQFLERLQQANVEVELVDFTHLTGGYGATHCTTQVLRRGQPSESRTPSSDK